MDIGAVHSKMDLKTLKPNPYLTFWTKSALDAMTPAMMSLWPLRYLVALCSTTSNPNAAGLQCRNIPSGLSDLTMNLINLCLCKSGPGNLFRAKEVRAKAYKILSSNFWGGELAPQ